ncbi:2-amino-4-hydroxy-6-hydroxymethyldihydropteridine diphosphokinase [Hippea sp. KM1]|uniref:2-amino-4-hydroxy-6- hydroxymethyldihydropteridine diphosphokinase n=1 Tax=Hippea sp. KM1 TaxID=944481 RepID=UPI00046CB279|nr:2-amino-4-hydroxy-6-hydroxymethyldihydropteridine diphosphokinase [Hippea sp. KM1]
MRPFNRWVYLSIGSNVGNRKKNLRLAVAYLKRRLSVVACSKFYNSEPWGYERQKNFCNMALKVNTHLKPYELLRLAKQIEKKLGRNKKFKWGPRTVDVDIVAYRNIMLKTKQLWLPHRWAAERLFVIVPLLDLGAHLRLNGLSLEELKGRLEGNQHLKTC